MESKQEYEYNSFYNLISLLNLTQKILTALHNLKVNGVEGSQSLALKIIYLRVSYIMHKVYLQNRDPE